MRQHLWDRVWWLREKYVIFACKDSPYPLLHDIQDVYLEKRDVIALLCNYNIP